MSQDEFRADLAEYRRRLDRNDGYAEAIRRRLETTHALYWQEWLRWHQDPAHALSAAGRQKLTREERRRRRAARRARPRRRLVS